MAKDMDLDVDAPDKVSGVLRRTARAYYQSSAELSAAWQERAAGEPWAKIADILERAAGQIDKIIK